MAVYNVLSETGLNKEDDETRDSNSICRLISLDWRPPGCTLTLLMIYKDGFLFHWAKWSINFHWISYIVDSSKSETYKNVLL